MICYLLYVSLSSVLSMFRAWLQGFGQSEERGKGAQTLRACRSQRDQGVSLPSMLLLVRSRGGAKITSSCYAKRKEVAQTRYVCVSVVIEAVQR